MTPDPFDQLRLDDESVEPTAAFAARLRARIVDALDATAAAADLPRVQLNERSTTMTDTATTTSMTAGRQAASSLTPYICVSPAVEAIAWYVDVLGAAETVRYSGDDGRIGHAELDLAGNTVMLSDEYPELDVVSPTTLGGTPTTLHLEVPDVDATYERAVAAGARVAEPPRDESYGARSFSMVDPFGHRWMVQTPIGSPTLDEIQAATTGYTVSTPDRPAALTPASVVELGYFTLGLPDIAVAGHFYGQLFGWATEPGNMGDGYAHVHNTKLPLGLTTGSPTEPPTLYFRVDDIAAVATRVRELGGEVLSEEVNDSGPNAACRDDQGRQFQLWQPAPGYE